MKTEDFKKVIKMLIKEEVKKAVAEEVNKSLGRVLVEMVKEIKSNTPTAISEEIEVKNATVIQTKNPKLNSVLSETARHFKPLPKNTSNLAELMGGSFEKIGITENDMNIVSENKEPVSNIDFMKQMVGESLNISNQPSALDGGAEVPDSLKKIFKKDFRSVMKKIDEQKKNGISGYIDQSSLLSG